ncbi:hypothetical protein [Nocardioides conyzicola]|uniref:Uncharacterized protein n=1 Tax=Nocardioides conyzicola TaxID=1651781 RepID=A0ABP8Y0F9_9ACTN
MVGVVTAEREDEVIQDAFAERAGADERRVVGAERECIPDLVEVLVVEWDDRPGRRTEIDEVLQLLLVVRNTELMDELLAKPRLVVPVQLSRLGFNLGAVGEVEQHGAGVERHRDGGVPPGPIFGSARTPELVDLDHCHV